MSDETGNGSSVDLSSATGMLLERVLSMSHQDQPEFVPLAECQLAACRIREQLAADQLPADVISEIVDGVHPLGAMARLVDDTEQLDDSRWSDLQAAVRDNAADCFGGPFKGEALFTAVSRGKLVIKNGDAASVQTQADLENTAEADVDVLAFEDELNIAGGSTAIRRKPELTADPLLDAFDADADDDDMARADVAAAEISDGSQPADPADDGGWVFDDLDDGPSSSRQASMIMHSRSQSASPAGPAPTGESNSAASDASAAGDDSDEAEWSDEFASILDFDGEEDESDESSVDADRDADSPDDGEEPDSGVRREKKFFRFMLYGNDDDERELQVPKRQLCRGWQFSEVVLFQYYQQRCHEQRLRGFTSCCTDTFEDVAAALGLPPRRVRKACVHLEQRGEIVLIPNLNRECRVWVMNGHLHAAGQRPDTPQRADDSAGDAPIAETRHQIGKPTMTPGLRELAAQMLHARTGT